MANSDYVPSSEQHSGPYLVGPMVIRVYPDGRPVPEDQKRPLPRDEDVDELRFSRLPSVDEIEAKSGSVFYGKGAQPNKPSTSTYAADEERRRQQPAPVVRFRGDPYERRAVLRNANERGLHYY